LATHRHNPGANPPINDLASVFCFLRTDTDIIREGAVGRSLQTQGGSMGCRMIFAALAAAQLAHSATLTPEVQKEVRAATFEVVMRKMDSDALTYEKPLPLDLVPYSIRSDRYWSIGTAFAIGPEIYVTAGHVFRSAVGSQFGSPALRDSGGHVYAVNQVLKYSAHEDFVVFTVTGAPPASPLPTTLEHRIDEVAFAVGNALGEGVVIRDGLLTSETPENQDGRWNWLRFSAATSPGNSGGPLLDSEGRVLGIVTAKSPNENLNYALPIGRVLDASSEAATFDLRYTIRLPNMRATQVATLKTQFPLPKKYVDFAAAYRKLTLDSTLRDLKQLHAALADQTFPKGNASKLLATVYSSPLPAFVQQDHNDVWDAVSAENMVDQDLPGKGLVSTGMSLGVSLFRLRRPDGAADDEFYEDSSKFMNLLLKGLKLPRVVGDQAIRIVSLGHAQRENRFSDQFGRRWQVSVWPLGYTDNYVVCYALPVPEGYVGMAQLVPSSQLDVVNEYLKLLADYVYVDYSGTVGQWKAFLARRELRPSIFDDAKLAVDEKMAVRLQSPRLALQVPKELMQTSADSELELRMAYMLNGDKLAWDIGGLYLYKNQDRQIYLGLERHVKPTDDSSKDLLETWGQMNSRGPGFNGVAGHDEHFQKYWIHQAISASWNYPGVDPSATVLYDVFYGTEANVYPRDLEDSERRWVQATHILEH
jgi:serine protease Do